jgi:ribose/xylose/arabinose/galactoside ABC-type transport system permease subunit
MENAAIEATQWIETQRLRLIALAGLLVLLSITYWLAPAFFTWGNLVNLLRQVSINGIIASGMTIVMIAGGFDLSVGAMLALSGVLAIHFARSNLFAGILIPLVVGMLGGWVNGDLISRFSINPLIVTLGSRYLFYAVANLSTAGFIQYNENSAFLALGRSSCLTVPTPSLIFLGVALLAHVLLRYTIAGAGFYAVGSNERTAYFSGLSSRSLQTMSYVATGVCAALAGIVLASRLGVAAPDAGEGYELEAIAAVVIGGTSMSGGSGSISQTLGGVLLLGVLSNLLILAGEPYEVQRIATGAIIVLAAYIRFYHQNNQ